jgi:hypothetical protein
MKSTLTRDYTAMIGSSPDNLSDGLSNPCADHQAFLDSELHHSGGVTPVLD